MPLGDTDGDDTIEGKVIYDPLHVKDSTFIGGLSEPVHRWFRLTPSFGPELVREVLRKIRQSERDVILDPFSGAGTTQIECQILGLQSYGFEINPFLHWVAKTSLDWSVDPETLRVAHRALCEQFAQLLKIMPTNPELLPEPIPPIHNPYRWWRKDVLRDLMLLKSAIRAVNTSSQVRSLLKLVLANTLVPELTNVTLGRLQLHFIDRSSDNIDVWPAFEKHLMEMIADLEMVEKRKLRKSEVLLMDSTHVSPSVDLPPMDCVITSPPYPNRYSYVWNTRPHLYFFDFFTKPKQAADLDIQTIGGTWGTATSILARGIVEPAYPFVKDVISPVADRIRESDNLMANYLVKYFNGLAKQVKEMDRLLQNHSRLAYVVGCSRLKGVYVETDMLLADVFERMGLGYSVIEVQRLRKRHSGINLHESIVYAVKS